MTNERATWCHLLFYFTYYALNIFRALIYPSSGACDCVDEFPHRSSCSQFVVCWRFGVAGFEWCSFCRLQPAKRKPPNTNRNKSSNTQRTENKTPDVVIHQHSRKLLKMDILMSETCWAHNKWNKIASDIKLLFHSSTIAMMHGPISIRHLLLVGAGWRGKRVRGAKLCRHHPVFSTCFKNVRCHFNLWMYCQHSQCFSNRYNAAWPFGGEQSSGYAVPIAAVCSVI